MNARFNWSRLAVILPTPLQWCEVTYTRHRMRSGWCLAEVYCHELFGKHEWVTFGADGQCGASGYENTRLAARAAALGALIRQAESGKPSFHLGKRSLEALRRFAAISALHGDTLGP